MCERRDSLFVLENRKGSGMSDRCLNFFYKHGHDHHFAVLVTSQLSASAPQHIIHIMSCLQNRFSIDYLGSTFFGRTKAHPPDDFFKKSTLRVILCCPSEMLPDLFDVFENEMYFFPVIT